MLKGNEKTRTTHAPRAPKSCNYISFSCSCKTRPLANGKHQRKKTNHSVPNRRLNSTRREKTNTQRLYSRRWRHRQRRHGQRRRRYENRPGLSVGVVRAYRERTPEGNCTPPTPFCTTAPCLNRHTI